MPLTVDSFKRVADSTSFWVRDIAIQGKGENMTAKLGNYLFSAGKTANKAVMDAFRTALQK